MRNWAGPLLGFRLIALSVVSGSAAFLPAGSALRGLILLGIASGFALAMAQYLCVRARQPIHGFFVLAHIVLWTTLIHLSTDQRSPLFIGYLLEVPLAALCLGRRGAVLAAGLGATAYFSYSAMFRPPLAFDTTVLAVGFLAASALLSWFAVEVLEGKQRDIDLSHAALHSRAESLSEELRLLGDYLDDALIVIDDLGRIASINRAGAELCGVSREAALGRAWQEVVRADDDGVRALTLTLAEGQPQRDIPMMLERGNGCRATARAELWTGNSAGGRKTYVLLDSRLPESDEPDPLRRLGEAVACVSHQIKNSIHALQGMATSVEAIAGPQNRESVRELLTALRGLGCLAESMLAMSGASRARDESIELSEVLSNALVLSRQTAGHATVVNDCPQVRVRGHRGELVHALFNLLDNAGRANPPGKTVLVRMRRDGTHALAEIDDAGPGMPPHVEHARARVHSLAGSGYGLLAARRFLESNGGQLSFERIPGGGTRCNIRLPIAEESGDPDRVRAMAAGARP